MTNGPIPAKDPTTDLLGRATAFQQPQSNAATRAYQRGWDDCLMSVYRVLGEKFTLPKGLPSAHDPALNRPLDHQ